MNRNALRNGLLVLCTAMLIVGGLGTSQYRKGTAFGPLFVDPFSLAVDGVGNLYCGVEFERVHKYSAQGRMIGAWSVEAASKPFRLRVADDSSIEVATSDGKLIRFDNVGKTISTRDDAGAFGRFGSSNDSEVHTESGIRYTIEEGSIVRSEGDSKALWVAGPGWPLRWIPNPVVPLTLLLIAAPVGMLASVINRGSPRAERSHGTSG